MDLKFVHNLLLLLWFEIFFCNCFSNQDSLSFKVLLNLKQKKIHYLWFSKIWNLKLNEISLLVVLKSSFDSLSPRELDRSLLSFSLHLAALLVHPLQHALPRLPQQLLHRLRLPLLLKSSLKLLLKLLLFLFNVVFQSEIFTLSIHFSSLSSAFSSVFFSLQLFSSHL